MIQIPGTRKLPGENVLVVGTTPSRPPSRAALVLLAIGSFVCMRRNTRGLTKGP